MFIEMCRYETQTEEELDNLSIEYAIDNETSSAELSIEKKLEDAVYPRYGYTTADVFNNEEEYEAWLREIFAAELEELKQWLTDVNSADVELPKKLQQIDEIEGLEASYHGGSYTVTVWKNNTNGGYDMYFYRNTDIPHSTEYMRTAFLESEMRKYQPDLRKWHKVAYEG